MASRQELCEGLDILDWLEEIFESLPFEQWRTERSNSCIQGLRSMLKAELMVRDTAMIQKMKDAAKVE